MDVSESKKRANVINFSLDLKAGEMPSSTLKMASLLLLDTIGISAGAASLEAGRIAREVACELYGASSSSEGAHILFDGHRVSLAGAAYAGATQIDNLDGHDGYNPVKGHIGAAVVPSLIAVSEQCPSLSGPDALAAMVVGYEVSGRAGHSLHATVSDYHTSGAWNALGVAAMAARLRGHSSDQLRQGLGIAEYHGPRSQMMREIANPTMLHDGSGWGAMVGVSSSILAEKGFSGAPAITVENEEVAHFWNDLGHYWITDNQYLKPYPICRWAHAPIDGVRGMCLGHNLVPENVEDILISTFHEAVCLYPGMPETTSQAQYSLPFSVASMIVHRQLGTEQITGENLKNPMVEELISRTRLQERDRHNERFPSGRWADVIVTLKDGSVLDSGDINARGGVEGPFTEQQIIEKFLSFTVPVLGQERAEKIIEMSQQLNDPQSKFSDFIALVTAPVN